jgi:predicted metal-dependent hydrolase
MFNKLFKQDGMLENEKFLYKGYNITINLKESNKNSYLKYDQNKNITINANSKITKQEIMKHLDRYIDSLNYSYQSNDARYLMYRGYNIVFTNKAKNKNTYARLKEDKSISVSAPYHVKVNDIYPLLDRLIDKIEKKIDLELVKKDHFDDLDTIYYLGQAYKINVINTKGNEFIKLDNSFNIYLKNINDKEKLNFLIKKFYLGQAEILLKQRFFNLLENFKHIEFIPILKIKRMTSKYGCCYYKRKEVVLSSLLMFYDIDCIDYVIIHELAHFIQPNHSKKFYYLIEQYIPNYKEYEKRLKNHLD